MDYRSELQETLDECGENYTLKTNAELIDLIVDTGLDKGTFHAADIERLLKEHKKLLEVLTVVVANLSLSGTNLENEYRKTEAIKTAKEVIDLYSGNSQVNCSKTPPVSCRFIYKDVNGIMNEDVIKINKKNSDLAIATFEKKYPNLVWREFSFI